MKGNLSADYFLPELSQEPTRLSTEKRINAKSTLRQLRELSQVMTSMSTEEGGRNIKLPHLLSKSERKRSSDFKKDFKPYLQSQKSALQH